jgi:hypothetical protein
MSLTPLEISIISACIAVAAFLVSLTTLWKTHFSKFNVIIAAGNLRHRIYPIKSEDEKWFMASFDIPLSFTNSGAKTGIVTGLRLRLHYSSLSIPDNCEFIYPNFEIDPKKSDEITKERFDWISKLLLARWMPFTVLPKNMISKHIVFETRWNDPVIQQGIDCSLEVETDNKQDWFPSYKWTLHLSPECWSELACVGTSMSYCQEGHRHGPFDVHPPDLHKYTGSKEPLPESGFNLKPSYLDYPEKENQQR